MLNGNRRRASYFFLHVSSSSFSSRLMHGNFCSIFFTRAQPLKRQTLLGRYEHIFCTNMLHLCRSYTCPGCVASGVDRYDCFFNSSIFCASFGSTWCSFRSLRNLSVHLGLGLIGFFLPTFIVDILSFSHHMGIPCNAALCDICGDWLDCCSSPEHFVFDSVIPDVALNPS